MVEDLNESFAMFLRNANGSLKEVETQLLVAKRLKFIGQENGEKIFSIVDEVGRMLYGLIEYQTKKVDSNVSVPAVTLNG
jgi:four helix bundle protein